MTRRALPELAASPHDAKARLHPLNPRMGDNTGPAERASLRAMTRKGPLPRGAKGRTAVYFPTTRVARSVRRCLARDDCPYCPGSRRCVDRPGHAGVHALACQCAEVAASG